MKELAEKLEDATETQDHDILRKACEKWAVHSLRTYRDPLLPKALAISASIAEFMAELETGFPKSAFDVD
jgi:hypothetical protein